VGVVSLTLPNMVGLGHSDNDSWQARSQITHIFVDAYKITINTCLVLQNGALKYTLSSNPCIPKSAKWLPDAHPAYSYTLPSKGSWPCCGDTRWLLCCNSADLASSWLTELYATINCGCRKASNNNTHIMPAIIVRHSIGVNMNLSFLEINQELYTVNRAK
jgi:hypothetical protein